MDLRSKIPEKPECRPIVFQIPEALPHFVHWCGLVSICLHTCPDSYLFRLPLMVSLWYHSLLELQYHSWEIALTAFSAHRSYSWGHVSSISWLEFSWFFSSLHAHILIYLKIIHGLILPQSSLHIVHNHLLIQRYIISAVEKECLSKQINKAGHNICYKNLALTPRSKV
jgi:hypothetical protein